MKYLLDIIYFFAFLIYLPKVLYRRFFQNRYKEGGRERLGYVSKHGNKKRCIWIHSVSVGEVNATKTLISELNKQLPDAEIVMSTTTDTGYARAKTLYGKDMSVFYYPLDFSWAVSRAFKRIEPDLCILVELEVWPNFAQEAQNRKVPLIVFNGRLSDKSFPRYKKLKAVTKWMFTKVSKFLVQTEQYKNRFIALGVDADKVIVTGSVKYDTAEITDNIEGSKELAEKLGINNDQQLFVAGGTGPGEESIILDVFKKLKTDHKNLRLAIVPRKPERFNEVAAMIERESLALVRYSKLKNSKAVTEIQPETVILGDTMGDLRKFYSLSEVVFVGRSLCAMGGSDMMESTAMGKFTTFGPHTFNFNQTVEVLLAGKGAVEVRDSKELKEMLSKALNEPEYKKAISENGQKVIKQNQGATARSVNEIKLLLK